MVSTSSAASLEAHSLHEQIEKLKLNATTELKESLEKHDVEVSHLLAGQRASTGHEEKAGLDEVSGELEGLYGQVGGADAPPTVAQQKAAEHIGEEMSEVMRDWEKLKANSLPALNHQLSAAHLPKIDLEQQPENMPESGDED